MFPTRKPKKHQQKYHRNQSADTEDTDDDGGQKEQAMQYFKLRKQLKMLQEVRCEQSSCISLYVPEKDKIFDVVNYICHEESSAASIKTTSNRKSVEQALSSIKERLKMLPQNQINKNGFIIFCAEGFTAKRLLVEIFSPPSPVKAFIYKCQATFHLEQLSDMLTPHPLYGYVVSDGGGYLIAKVQATIEIVSEKSESLPNKHNKGGQSSLRFSRLCEATRERLAKNTSEAIVRAFADGSGMKTQVRGIILCGMSHIKDRVMKELLDLCPAIAAKIIGQFDVGYGGRAGLRQALAMSSELLQSEKFSIEKQIISEFMTEFTQESGTVVFGAHATMQAIQDGNVKKLILFEDNTLERVSVYQAQKDSENTAECIKYLRPDEIEKYENNGNSVFARSNFVEWLVNHAEQSYLEQAGERIQMEFVSDSTEQGYQFAKAFQGVAAFLKFQKNYDTNLDEIDNFDEQKDCGNYYSYDDDEDEFI